MWGEVASLLLLLPVFTTAKGLCEVETGQTNLILDIQESKGTSTSQETVPNELPISGDPWNEIALELIFTKVAPSFILNGKKLQLIKPLDRDQDNISHVVFQLQCTIRATGRKKTIPVIVRVTDINDNTPMFLATPYQTSVSEATPVGTTIFQGLKAIDGDAGVNGLVEYRIVEGELPQDPSSRVITADGASHFAIHLPHQGQVTVSRALDYERTQRYLVTVVATDRARNVSERFSATTTLTVNVRDADDQEPSFIYQGCTLLQGSCINPEYSATVSSGILSGVLAISPEKIQAVDMDSLNSPIAYSLLSGSPPSFTQFFEINPSTGIVKQIKPVDSSSIKKFEIIVKAEEVSEARRFATAKLFITVKPVDSSPPQISASASEGSVDENAPVGTKVLDRNNNPISFSVSDPDIGPDDAKPTYTYELTSNFFNINSEGLLVVGSDQLDRDPPSPGIFRFQVVAREKQGTAASAPLTMMVSLNDVNDNAPRLPMLAPLSVQAGENHRTIAQVTATDNDIGVNAEISYSIYHVSNNGRNKFKIDPQSGDIEAIGKLTAGEQNSITVQATDAGGKFSQTIVEVTVVPGPNTQSPQFPQSVYEVSVSEGAPINSTVATITAVDPENEPVTYSIVSGNDLRQFGINDRLGVISVIRRLDREDLTRYQLVIKAEDEGGLSSTATVNVKVSDINDKNPEFTQASYSLSVKEGLVGAHLGRIIATDADEGANAVVTYSLPSDVPFTIDQGTGDIFTNTALDYEQHKEYKFIVTAQDGAPEPRLATATVTVSVIDTEDELPIFHQPNYEAKVLENLPDYVITQVKADDPDTMKRVTYIMKQGPTEFFSVDPKSGKVKTVKGLDYETESQHTLIIGTEENNSTRPGATTKVIIHVEDRNDIPPVFMMVPRPITLDDDTPIGTKVTTLIATDSDGTSPGNKVRYEIVGRGKATKYFHIDPDLGTITVRDDLSKEPDSEYQIDVKASDLGSPQLSSITSVAIFVRRTATVAPDPNLGFPEDSYTIHVSEDTSPGALLRRFEVLSTRTPQQVPLRCSIVQTNYSDIFVVKTTGGKECELRLGDNPLDYEKKSSYQINLQIDSLAGLINPAKNQTSVKIEVDDVNDNGPYFVYPPYSKLFKKDKYFGGVPKDTKEIGSLVLQVQAKDPDSGRAGMIEYSLVNSTRWAGFFNIDPLGGFIRTARSLDQAGERPIVLHVQARDGPTNGTNHLATTQVVINEISDEDRVVLTVGGLGPEKAKEFEVDIVSSLEQSTGLIVGVEKVTAPHDPPNNVTSAELWVYFIDPTNETILSRNTTKIERDVLSDEGVNNMTKTLSEALIDVWVESAAGPPVQIQDPVRTAVLALQWDAFPLAVILIAILILLLGGAGIVYICVSWSRYKAYKERMQRMYVMPRYDPVFVEPNLKEYETQVLQMSVPMDDSDSYHDLQIDFSQKNHAFSLDNVSYITKDHRNGGSPASSEAATTARASSIGRHNNNNSIQGNINHSYHRSEEDLGPGSASPTNENVIFREKKDYSHMGFNYLMDRSIETTTEL